jgi:predicted alpha/beta-fold hydrolase
MDWLGRAKVEFTHAPSPRVIKEKDGRETDILKIVETNTPPCQLNPLLFNGHLQTFWTATKPGAPAIYYKRKIFQAENELYHGTFATDFVVDPYTETDAELPERTTYYTDTELESIGSDDSKPMLVVLHGLSGGSHEIYLRHAIAPLIGKGGWEVCVVNSRGCAGSKFTSGVLYNARATWDCRQVSLRCRPAYTRPANPDYRWSNGYTRRFPTGLFSV